MRKNTEQQLQLELNVHLEEYRAKMSDMAAEISAMHQTFSLTITAIGFVLAASPFIVQFQVALVFAFASLVFYGLALTQLRYSWTVLAVENYIAQDLRPSIQEILMAISPQRKKSIDNVLLWSAVKSRSAYAKHWWQRPAEFARYLIPVGAGVCCCIAYWITPSPRNTLIDVAVVLINVLSVGYVVLFAFSRRSQFIKNKEQQESKNILSKNN